MSTLYQRDPAVEGVALDEQEVLFHQTTNKFVLVNPTARFVWAQLAAPRSSQAIADALCDRHAGVDRAAAGEQVTWLLEQLAARSFVQSLAGSATGGLAVVSAPQAGPYHAPGLRDVTEEEVLASFQMTAAEISAASCWWFSCATGCP